VAHLCIVTTLLLLACYSMLRCCNLHLQKLYKKAYSISFRSGFYNYPRRYVRIKSQWSEHISNITNKANKALGFLHWNLKSCPPHIKSSCYKSLIVPIIEYGSTVWDPHLHKDINKLEKIQRCAARFVKNDYSWDTSVTSLINDLQWKTLKIKKNFPQINNDVQNSS